MARGSATRTNAGSPYARSDTLNQTYGPIGLSATDLNGTGVAGGQGIDVRRRADNALAPVVVYVFGGGWESSSGASSGGSAAFSALLNWATINGFAFVSMDYRNAGTNEANPRNCTIADELADLQLALSWIASHAATYNLDLARLVLISGSAGAHLALQAVFNGCALSPKLWIGLSGPYQLDFQPPPANALGPPYLHNVTFASSYSTPTASLGTANDWDKLSPTYLVSGSPARSSYPAAALVGLPSLLIVHGDSDTVVPVFCARQLDAALTARGIAHTYNEVAGADHASISWARFYPLMWPAILSAVGPVRGPAPARAAAPSRGNPP